LELKAFQLGRLARQQIRLLLAAAGHTDLSVSRYATNSSATASASSRIAGSE